jgi:hypothetical protein
MVLKDERGINPSSMSDLETIGEITYSFVICRGPGFVGAGWGRPRFETPAPAALLLPRVKWGKDPRGPSPVRSSPPQPATAAIESDNGVAAEVLGTSSTGRFTAFRPGGVRTSPLAIDDELSDRPCHRVDVHVWIRQRRPSSCDGTGHSAGYQAGFRPPPKSLRPL